MNALTDHSQFARNTDTATASDMKLRAFQQGRLLGLRSNRYSWWTHARELADFILPRRYKWLITQNQQSRGSPINQHILDSTGTLAARNLAAGIFSGVCPPTRPWIKYKYGRIDSTQSGPIPIWLKQCEELTYAVLAASGFYTSMAVFLFDLVVFGTAALLIYEDFDFDGRRELAIMDGQNSCYHGPSFRIFLRRGRGFEESTSRSLHGHLDWENDLPKLTNGCANDYMQAIVI